MMKRYLYFIAATALLASCDDDLIPVNPVEPVVVTPDSPVYTPGTADFTNFVTLGNSLTAGFSDNALFIAGQETSYPNTLAGQMQLAGGGEFTQPLMADNLGGMTLGGQPLPGSGNRLYLADPFGSPAPTPVPGQGTTEVSDILSGPFNNMGVPGAKSYHLAAPGYGSLANLAVGAANPYYVRMATSPDATVIGDALQMNPSFFSLWIGNNDILGFATSGGIGVDRTGTGTPISEYGGADITDPTAFAGIYGQLVDALTSNGAKGILCNIPDVTTIPYFTTVPYNAIPLDAATAAALNAAFTPYNNGVLQVAGLGLISAEEAEARQVSFVEGQNAALILDEDLTDLTGVDADLTNMRQATAADLLVLTSTGILGTPADENNPLLINGVSVPLADNWVLTATEVNMVNTAKDAYNATIASIASAKGLALFDAEAGLFELANGGITMNGLTTTSTFATGGAFSLDGVHPSPRGYAIISNLMMTQINATFGSNLPAVNVKDFTGVYLN
jgi:hypothetical protein